MAARNSPAGLLRGLAGCDPARTELPDGPGTPGCVVQREGGAREGQRWEKGWHKGGCF